MTAPVPTENSDGTVGNLRPFRPGQSGNPGGRPVSLSTLIREQTLDGRELVAFMMNVLRGRRKAPLKLRMEAVAWLADRGFGKAVQQIEHGNIEGEGLVIRVEYDPEAADLDPDRSAR